MSTNDISCTTCEKCRFSEDETERRAARFYELRKAIRHIETELATMKDALSELEDLDG